MVNGRGGFGDRSELLKYFLRTQPLVNADVSQRLARAARVQPPLVKHSGSFRMLDNPIGNAGV